MSNDLLPCPFCGDTSDMLGEQEKRGLYLYHSDPSGDTKAWSHICCLNCGAEHASVDKWNTRVISGNKVAFRHESGGAITDGPVWLVIDGGYMYGPCDKWEDVAELIRTEWQNDRHLVG